MQALLSFENAPSFAAPLRFFLTAPLFALLAGLLIAFEGPSVFVSRWMPVTLAVTHLITLGFMLQVMLGALIQILPVVAGANLPRPLLVARLVHLGLSLGALLLAGGFYFALPSLLSAAAHLLGLTVLFFALVTLRALLGVPSTSPTILGLKLAMLALVMVTGLGILLALGLVKGWSLPLLPLTDLHAGWGLAGWAGGLLAAMAYVVVPMFQLTPGYPARPSWLFPWALLLALACWTLAVWGDWPVLLRVSQVWVALFGMSFVALTQYLQTKRRRARADATYRFWQLGLGGSFLALLLLLTAAIWPDLASIPGWTIGFGILLIAGGLMPFIIGMLYKIIPFLAWLHLQNHGQAKVAAPAMNKILSDLAMQRQMQAYCAAFALLLAAVFWPEWLARPAGLAFALANGWLWLNLLTAIRRYRQHRLAIDAKLAIPLPAI